MQSHRTISSILEENKQDVDVFIRSVSDILEKIVKKNDKEILASGIPLFNTTKRPLITIDKYLSRFKKHLLDENPNGKEDNNTAFIFMMIGMFIYIDIAKLQLTSYNIHNAIAIGLCLVHKVYFDYHYKNAGFAKILDLTLQDFNFIEYTMLNKLNFKCQIETDTFEQYYLELIKYTESNKLNQPEAALVSQTTGTIFNSISAASINAPAQQECKKQAVNISSHRV